MNIICIIFIVLNVKYICIMRCAVKALPLPVEPVYAAAIVVVSHHGVSCCSQALCILCNFQ